MSGDNLTIGPNHITPCESAAPMFKRCSFRRQALDTHPPIPRLTGARSHDRIAGYFSFSIFEVVDKALIAILRSLVAGVGTEENDRI